jgi:hypothetical protein
VSFECSKLAIDGRQDFSMLVHFPTEENVALRIDNLLSAALLRRQERLGQTVALG